MCTDDGLPFLCRCQLRFGFLSTETLSQQRLGRPVVSSYTGLTEFCCCLHQSLSLTHIHTDIDTHIHTDKHKHSHTNVSGNGLGMTIGEAWQAAMLLSEVSPLQGGHLFYPAFFFFQDSL